MAHDVRQLIWQDPERHSGDVCFYGTRIPVAQFFQGLQAGKSIDDFNEAFPQIGRERLEAVLGLGLDGIETRLKAA